jgi:hypothetical protein
MKRILHAAVVILAFVPWVIGCLGFGAAIALALLADRILPNARHGNCWSFALPRWWRNGGYLLVRWANGMPVPHAAWVRRLSDGNELEQTAPLHRVTSWALLWKTLYFPFRVTTVEKPQNAREARE